MDRFEFTIPGRPTAWQRTNDVKGRKVTPKAMREAQARIRGYARHAAERAGLTLPLAGCLKLEVLCVYAIPEGFRGAKRDAALNGQVYRPSVPDWDNLGKQVSDACNPQPVRGRRPPADPFAVHKKVKRVLEGGIYTDDSQICDARVVKRYGEPERTVVRLTVLPDWAPDTPLLPLAKASPMLTAPNRRGTK